jgi:hypothetical protein
MPKRIAPAHHLTPSQLLASRPLVLFGLARLSQRDGASAGHALRGNGGAPDWRHGPLANCEGDERGNGAGYGDRTLNMRFS